jgi:hypothetical protein
MGLFDSISNMFGGSAPESSGSTFQSRILSLGRRVGLKVVLDDDGDPVACFVVPVQGQTYSLIVSQTGATAHLSALSNVKFPPGQLPQEVLAFLANKNREIDCGEFDIIETRRHSYFVMRSVVRWHRLTADIIKGAVNELVGRIAALDIAMVNEGYA